MDLHIYLGNDAMQTRRDVSRALKEIAAKIDAGHSHGVIFDVNGNSVGSWSLHGELEGESCTQ